MPFDRAQHVVISEGLAFYGSTIDGKVRAVNLKTGKTAWSFYTEGPIRFAPTVWKDRLFVASDDGCLYALSVRNGALLWKKRGGPDRTMVIGNRRMISKWPARGGPVVSDGVVYFAAGIWPSDGIFLYALNARTGKTKWRNTDSGKIYMGQPHGGAYAASGVAAQGYLVVSGDTLFVPTGRAVPAAFDRQTGKFLYFHLQRYGHNGGSPTMAIDGTFFNSGLGFDAKTGVRTSIKLSGLPAASRSNLFVTNKRRIIAYEWAETTRVDRRGNKTSVRTPKPLWACDTQMEAQSIAVTNNLIISGGRDRVNLIDRDSKKVVKSLDVQGTVYGLSVTGKHLIASTDTGQIFCFSSARPKEPKLRKEGYPESVSTIPNDPYTRAAKQIIDRTKVKEGYALDLDCGDASLAIALARVSKLTIMGIAKDDHELAAARKKLEAANLYGWRVMVIKRNMANTLLPQYFANLIVSGKSTTAESDVLGSEVRKEIDRLQRPYSGVVAIGAPNQIKPHVRGALMGAGQWTHQYANPGNTLNSEDDRIKGKLTVLWYRDVNHDVPQRHGRAPAPLFLDGRLIHAGLDSVVAVDAYNGRVLWRYTIKGLLHAYHGDELMGTAGTGGVMCISKEGLFVRHDSSCYQINTVTGELIRKHELPTAKGKKPQPWGYLAVSNGVLYGSAADPTHTVTYRYVKNTGDMKKQLTESSRLFAIDLKTGKRLWEFKATHSIRHNAIAIGSRHVYLIDRPMAKFDRVKKSNIKVHPFGKLYALDPFTGKEKWSRDKEVFATTLTLSNRHKTLLLSYQPTRFRLDSEIGGRMAAVDANSGRVLWDKKLNYRARPMINDNVVYAEGGAWELKTGSTIPFAFSRSYGCGVLTGGRNMLLFRSATLGYFNLNDQKGTQNFGGVRPGCWINVIPAGGLVLAPDASAGCRCSYLNQSWFALQTDEHAEPSIRPAAGTYPTTREIRLGNTDDSRTIYYTTDGSTPTKASTKFTRPFQVKSTTTVKAIAVNARGQVTRIASATYHIDPTLIPVRDSRWQIHTPKGPTVIQGPAKWLIQNQVVRQTSNIFNNTKQTMSPDPEAERRGTMRIFQPDKPFGNGTLSLEIRSDDDDSVGVAFRLKDDKHFYLFAMDAQRKFTILALKSGDQYKVLAKVTTGYTPRKWHQVRVVALKDRLKIYVDGHKRFDITDSTIQSGAIALYSWGNSNSNYRNLRWIPAH